jgi:hypothetical protein
MLVGLAVKELIVGGDTGCSVAGAGSCVTIVMQPVIEPIRAARDMAISVKYHLCFIIRPPVFTGIIGVVRICVKQSHKSKCRSKNKK